MRACVLCGGDLREWDSQSYSWQGFRYCYLRCARCASLVCDPVPDATTLARLYSVDYATAFADGYVIDSPRSSGWVKDYLTSRPPGTFIDFGCGDGSVLSVAVDAGWKAVGVELDPAVAARASETSGCPVLISDDVSGAGRAEVVHLGDVIEHLPDPAAGVRRALSLLAPEGVLLAQGPLEAGPSLFSAVVRPARRRHRDAVELPPYHLVQATSAGQREHFYRAGLVERSYDVFEVDWPAPSALSARDLGRPRTVGLYALRRISGGVDRVASALSSRFTLGNRFRYVGALPVAGKGLP